jgi:hypothetical protein
MKTNKRFARFTIHVVFIGLFGLGLLALMDMFHSWRLGRFRSIYHLPVLLPIGVSLVTMMLMSTFFWMETFKIKLYQRPTRFAPLRFWPVLLLCIISILGTSYTYIYFQAAHLLARTRLSTDVLSEALCLFFFWFHLIAFVALIRTNLSHPSPEAAS